MEKKVGMREKPEMTPEFEEVMNTIDALAQAIYVHSISHMVRSTNLGDPFESDREVVGDQHSHSGALTKKMLKLAHVSKLAAICYHKSGTCLWVDQVADVNGHIST